MRARLLLLGLAVVWPALAADRPLRVPVRDVDVVYDVPLGSGTARQRLRFSAARQSMRIDPPGGGLYVVIDQARGRMFTVRDVDRSVIDMAAPRAWMPGMGGAAPVRRDQNQIIGHACTEWTTTDSENRTIVMCVTADGVMLRAMTEAGITLLTAASVHYVAQDAAIFAVPDSYRRLAPPPIPNAR